MDETTATKTDEQKFDDVADDRVRPSPKERPPRHDLRNNIIDVSNDPDFAKDAVRSVMAMDGYPDPPLPPKPVKPVEPPKPVKPVDPPKPPKPPEHPHPRPDDVDVTREDLPQEVFDRLAPYLLDAVRGDRDFLDYLTHRIDERRPTTDLLVDRHAKLPAEIKTYGNCRELVQNAGGIETLERQVKLPPKEGLSLPGPAPEPPFQPEPAPQLVLDPPARPPPGYDERREAAFLLAKTFPGEDALKWAHLHAEDIWTLVRAYRSYVPPGKSLATLITARPRWFTKDMDKVSPWTEPVTSASGELTPVALLDPDEQRYYQHNHRLRVVGVSHAWEMHLREALTRDGGIPPRLVPFFEKALLAHDVPADLTARMEKVGFQQPGTWTLPDDTYFLSASPVAFQKAYLAFARGSLARHLFEDLFQGDGAVHENMTPLQIANGVVRIYRKAESLSSPLKGYETGETFANSFLRQAMARIRAVVPEKSAAVMTDLWARLPIQPEARPVEPMDMGWIPLIDSFYPQAGSRMASARVSVYHGVEPETRPSYPTWQQGRVWEMTRAEERDLLAEARSWMGKPVLKEGGEEMVPDARFRAALDLAIRSFADGKYAGGLPAPHYNRLVAELTHQDPDETLLTVQGSAMTLSSRLRALSNRIASGQVSAEEASIDLTMVADLAQKQEVVAQAQQQSAEQGQAVQAFQKLTTELVRLASSNPTARGLLQPVLDSLRTR